MNPKETLEGVFIRRVLALPDALVARLAGPVDVADGRTLDPRVRLLIRATALVGKRGFNELEVPVARREMAAQAHHLSADAPVPTRPVSVGPLRGLRFTPAERDGKTLLWFHGGGHVVGSPASHAPALRWLAARAGVEILAVDYPLAPEHPFPQAPDACLAAFRYLAGGQMADVDPSRVILGGDSAGGNLAAVVALDTGDDAVRPLGQVLVYPVLSVSGHGFRSRHTFARGYYLDDDAIRWYADCYLQGANPDHPRASPWEVADVSGQPPAVVLTAGFDPLRDEGEAWAERLRRAGVAVSHVEAPSQIHGFMHLSGAIPSARPPMEALADWLRRR